jgi:hypothetical protein
MLKIGTVKFRGTCSRHPRFDPEADGVGAIKGGCSRCQDLQTIFENHQRTLALMRTFAPPPTERRTPAHPGPDLQQDLFATLA